MGFVKTLERGAPMDANANLLEQQHLEQTLRQIAAQLGISDTTYAATKAELDKVLDTYWQTTYADFWDEAQLTEIVEREKNIAEAARRRRAHFAKMLSAPYFGRIDFRELQPNMQTNLEMVYIGIATLADPNSGELLVFDWRSPIAGMFYDFQTGPAHYHCPIGEIHGAITLKRQYKIADGQLNYWFDSDLTIEDEILQEILGRSTDQKMRTIVNSIQREQNQIIRDADHRVLLVQGPAGSGKTSIALHRAAYLLYRERDTLTAKQILIFSPNYIFADYISNVLPELGEANVRQTTFQDYIDHTKLQFPAKVEDWNEQLELFMSDPGDPATRTRAAGIGFKSAPVFAELLESYLQHIMERLVREYPKLTLDGENYFSREEWEELFQVNLAYLPPAKRLRQIRKVIQQKLRPLVRRSRAKHEAAIAATGEEVNEKTIRVLARLAAKAELEPLTSELVRRTELDPFQLYQQLFRDEALFARLTAGLPLPENWPEIRRQTLEWFENGRIMYEDSLPLLYFHGCLSGFPVRGDIRQLIIDEAQDFTILQYRIVNQLFPRCAWTILGDRSQSIHPYLQTADFQTAAAILGATDSRLLTLQKSYRSTSEIQSFAQAVSTDALTGEPIRRSGMLPQVYSFPDPEGSAAGLQALIDQIRADGLRSIALITKAAQQAEILYRLLQPILPIHLIKNENSEFHRGIVAIPGYLAKGLEFDAVLVWDANAQNYAAAADRNLFYTVCTRALHRLFICHSGELTPFVAAIPAALYQTRELPTPDRCRL